VFAIKEAESRGPSIRRIIGFPLGAGMTEFNGYKKSPAGVRMKRKSQRNNFGLPKLRVGLPEQVRQ
jgi:hypothetical protein